MNIVHGSTEAPRKTDRESEQNTAMGSRKRPRITTRRELSEDRRFELVQTSAIRSGPSQRPLSPIVEAGDTSTTEGTASPHNHQHYREASTASSSSVSRLRERRSASPDTYAMRFGFGYPTGFLDRAISEYRKARNTSSSPAAHSPSRNPAHAIVSQAQIHRPDTQVLGNDEEEMKNWIEAMIFQNDNGNQTKQRPLRGPSANMTSSTTRATPEESTRNLRKDKGKGQDPELYPHWR